MTTERYVGAKRAAEEVDSALPDVSSQLSQFLSRRTEEVEFRNVKRRKVDGPTVVQPSSKFRTKQVFKVSNGCVDVDGKEGLFMLAMRKLPEYLIPQTLGKRSLRELTASMKRSGQLRPVLLDCRPGCAELDPNVARTPMQREKGDVWYAAVYSGHDILAAAYQLGWTHVMVKCLESARFDDAEEQESAYGYTRWYERKMLRKVNPGDLYFCGYAERGIEAEQIVMPAIMK
jgi:hypothetical protein